jgi:hypothetical protein
MTTYNADHVTVAGVAATYHAAAAGDKVKPGVTLIVKNANAATRTLTLVTPGTQYGQAIGDQAVVIPALTGERIIKVPDVGFTGSDGLVPLAWSATADVTFAVLDVD